MHCGSHALWQNVHTRGPSDGPSTTARAAVRVSAKRSKQAREGRSGEYSSVVPRPLSQQHGACNAVGGTSVRKRAGAPGSLPYKGAQAVALAIGDSRSSAGVPQGTPDSAGDAAEQRPRVTISYEDEDEPYTAVPASSAKTLKINVDLMIVGAEGLAGRDGWVHMPGACVHAHMAHGACIGQACSGRTWQSCCCIVRACTGALARMRADVSMHALPLSHAYTHACQR